MATERKYLSLEKLGLYDEKIKKFVGDADGVVLQSAKDYADGLADNYDAAGSAASAQAAAEAKAKELVDAEALVARAAEQANATAAAGALTAAQAADAKAVAAQEDVDALEELVGELPAGTTATTVVEYVNKKTEGIATDAALGELQGQLSGVQGEVATIKGDYLKAADKTELAGKITAEENRAKGVEGGFETRIAAIESDYLKAADKTALQEQITTNANAIKTLTDGVDAEKVDGVKDLIDYVEEHGTEVTGMKEDIAENAGKISTLEGKMSTAEGKISALEGASATHATTAALEEAVEALEGADAEMAGKIAALEGKFGGAEGSVEDMIADAKAAAISDAVAQAEAKDVTRIAEAKKYTDDTITGLKLADTYAAKVHGHEMSEVNGLADALAGKQAVGDYATKAEAQAMADGKDAAIQAAKKAGDDAAAALEAYKTTNDAAVKANADAIAAFVEISEAEINQLFA